MQRRIDAIDWERGDAFNFEIGEWLDGRRRWVERDHFKFVLPPKAFLASLRLRLRRYPHRFAKMNAGI